MIKLIGKINFTLKNLFIKTSIVFREVRAPMGLSIFIVMICLLEFFQLSVIKQWHNFYNHLAAVCLPTAIILTHFAKRIARTQGPSWPRILGRLLPAGKLGRSDSQIGRSYRAKLRHFLSI